MSTITNVFEAKKKRKDQRTWMRRRPKTEKFITEKESSAPAISTEALFLTCIINALKKRDIATTYIPGAFMQADMDGIVTMKIEGKMAQLMKRK